MTYTSGIQPDIINKYQGVAPAKIIHAVEKAAKSTGVDFSFLMDKAATESSFNPAAKAKGSSATGLFQFIENTWLSMIKQHGAKYGLQKYADQITFKNGKACVTDCDVKEQILALRKNPEISALMAGEFSADNKEYLERNTRRDVGSTEMYLAHFMGAGGAAKFINCLDCAPDTSAAALFPNAARANKAIFYDGGKARSLDEVYNLFAKKFGDTPTGGTTPPTPAAQAPLMTAHTGSTPAPRASTPPAPSTLDLAGALPSFPVFDDADESDDIIWNDDPRFVKMPAEKLNAHSLLVLAQAAQSDSARDRFGFNS